ncbi:MAG: mycofactocin biosynthesis glycosyltransferase MftF, partial [Actinomycetota bacterium]
NARSIDLATGTVVRLETSARSHAGGRLWFGGAPFRMLNVNQAVADLLNQWKQPTAVTDRKGEGALARRLELAGFLHIVAPVRTQVPTMSVVIPTHGRVEEVTGLLEDLHDLDVLVVDDGTEAMNALQLEAACHLHGAKYIRHELPLGPAAARNSGAALATGDVVCFIDSDVVPDRNMFPDLLAHFTDPVVGAVAPRIVVAGGTGQLHSYESWSSPLDLGPEAATVRPRSRVSYVPSALLFVRRELATQFNESLHVGEDVDFIWSIEAQGWLIRYDPASTATHPVRPTLASWCAQRFTYGTSAGELTKRHGDATTPIATSGWTALSWLGFLSFNPVIGVGSLIIPTVVLGRRLRGRAPAPYKLAASTVILGSLNAGPPLARQSVRTYGPLLIAAGILLRPLRLPLLCLQALAFVPRWWMHRRASRFLPACCLQVLDDLSYACGVLAGAAHAKTRGALRPSFTWFSSSSTTED